MDQKVRFATIGTSKITEKFLAAAKLVPDFELEAVYSRNMERAETFGKKHGAGKYYDRLEALAEDPRVDAVYIASPNMMHCSQALYLMQSGKHILCEKALASNEQEVRRMFAAAQEHEVVLLEAMRTIHDPALEIIRKHLGGLGKIRHASLNFCQYSSRYDSFREGVDHNIFRRECSAGALMDIGVYCVHALLYLFGRPERITSESVMLRGEIDGMGNILAAYPEMTAQIIYSKITSSCMPSEIQGENGIMRIRDICNPLEISIWYPDGREECLYQKEPQDNMKYEIERFIKMIHGEEKSDAFRNISLDAIKIMDEVRKQCHIVFPADR